MKKGDKLLIGMDLKKNPRIIQRAYDDERGITRDFNLNLLHRINSELECNIDVKNFEFYSYYNPELGEVKSYLISLRNQTFYSNVLNKQFYLKKDELIWTELSKKYSLQQINELAAQNDFTVVENFFDEKHFYTDSLWEKII